MSDFTDDEDRRLVQLALAFTSCGKLIPWDRLAARMTHSTHSKEALRQRLKTLKRTHGKDLLKFPPWFFRKTPVWGGTRRESRKSKASHSKYSLPSIELVCGLHRANMRRKYDGSSEWNAPPLVPLLLSGYHEDTTSELMRGLFETPQDCEFEPSVSLYDGYENGAKRSSLELLADAAAQRSTSFSSEYM